jgi:hypothetical protein
VLQRVAGNPALNKLQEFGRVGSGCQKELRLVFRENAARGTKAGNGVGQCGIGMDGT